MHDEAEIRLVEAHAERARSDEHLDAIGDQIFFCGARASVRRGPNTPRTDALRAQERGLIRRGNSQRVDDATQPASLRRAASQPSRCAALGSSTTASRSDSRSSEPRSTSVVRAKLLGDIVDPCVGRCGRREHGHATRQLREQCAMRR